MTKLPEWSIASMLVMVGGMYVGSVVKAADQPVVLAADVEEEADAADIDEEANHAPKIELNVRPTSVQTTKSIRFGPDGNPQQDDESTRIQLQCEYSSSFRPMAYEVVGMEAESVTGKKLTIENRRSRSTIHHNHHHQNQGVQRFSIYCTVQGPVDDVHEIAELRGKVQLELAEGPLRRAVLKPFKELQGKRIRIAEMPELLIGMTSEEDGQRVRVNLSGGGWDLFDQATFQTATGGQIDSRGWGGGHSNNGFNRSYHVTMPEDGTVILSFWSAKRTVEVPIRVEDIPMPGTMRDPDEPELVFHFEGDELGRPGGDAGDEGDLEVIVE